jgi:hypothetical protein
LGFVISAASKVEKAKRQTARENASPSDRLIAAAELLHSIGHKLKEGLTNAPAEEMAAALQVKQMCQQVTDAIDVSASVGSNGEPHYQAVLRPEAKGQLLAELQRVEGLGNGDLATEDLVGSCCRANCERARESYSVRPRCPPPPARSGLIRRAAVADPGD